LCFVLAATGSAVEGADVGLVHRLARMFCLVERGEGGGSRLHVRQCMCLLCGCTGGDNLLTTLSLDRGSGTSVIDRIDVTVGWLGAEACVCSGANKAGSRLACATV
jgi:hypothetical protein